MYEYYAKPWHSKGLCYRSPLWFALSVIISFKSLLLSRLGSSSPNVVSSDVCFFLSCVIQMLFSVETL